MDGTVRPKISDLTCCLPPFTIQRGKLPSLLSRKALVQKREYLGYVELDVLKIEIFLIIFLHLE